MNDYKRQLQNQKKARCSVIINNQVAEIITTLVVFKVYIVKVGKTFIPSILQLTKNHLNFSNAMGSLPTLDLLQVVKYDINCRLMRLHGAFSTQAPWALTQSPLNQNEILHFNFSPDFNPISFTS